MKIDQAEVVNDSGRKLPKVAPKDYFILFTRVDKGFQVIKMARVRSNGKGIWRLTQAEVVNDSGPELPIVPPKHCESVHWFV